MVDKLYLNSDTVHKLQSKLVRDITVSGWKPELVVGLARGGLYSAVCLSHWFNVPMLSCHVSLRDWAQQQSMRQLFDHVFDEKYILIVDDINDTGASLSVMRNTLEEHTYRDTFTRGNIRTAVLVNNMGSSYETNYSAMEIDKREHDQWVVFPWEEWHTM